MIRALRHKADRVASGLTLLEGERLIQEALRSGTRLDTVVGTADFWGKHPDLIHRLSGGIRVFQVSPAQLQALAVTEHPAGCLAVVARPAWTGDELWRLTGRRTGLGMLTVGVQDPGNIGTLIRTLAAAGGTGAWLGPGCAEAASPKVLRASAGSVLRLPVVETSDASAVLAEVHARGWQSLAAVTRGGRPFTTCDLTRSTLFVLGGEGGGLAPEWVRACQHAVHIPMPGGTESLNVGVAGAVLIYEAVRQRRLAQAPKRENVHAHSDPEPAQ